MWEYFVQNKDLWILAPFGVAAILTTLYYQIFGWRRNDRSFDMSVLATFTLAVAGSVVLTWRLPYMPYPPFTWAQRLRENIPSDCGSHGCWQEVPYLLAFFLPILAIGAVWLVILWGPWWLIHWRRHYLEKRKAEEAARAAEVAREADAARLAVAAKPFRRGDTDDFLKDP